MDKFCMLRRMFELRVNFMRSLADARPSVVQSWPLDLSTRESQQSVRSSVLKGVEEIFECLTHLKGWKSHRLNPDMSFDREAFLEEFVDALNYFMSALIMMGVTPDELFDAFVKKDKIIHDRISNGY